MKSFLVLVLALIPISQAQTDEADDGARNQKQAQAVSKETYDKIAGVQETVDYVEGMGVSLEDIEPDNLQFYSESYLDCIAQVEEGSFSKDELAIGTVSCVKRHAETWKSEIAGSKPRK